MRYDVARATEYIKDHLNYKIKGIDEVAVILNQRFTYSIIILIDGKHLTISLEEYEIFQMFKARAPTSDLFNDVVVKVNKAIEMMFLFGKTSFNYSEL